MHYDALVYARRAVDSIPHSSTVLELGSYNVNGSVRELFKTARAFIGVDRREGPGVDIVSDAVDLKLGSVFDLVISTEMLEHAEDPEKVIQVAWESLKPGGYLILTAAAPERDPHSNNGDHGMPEDEHYGGIHPEDLRRWLSGWEVLSLEHHPDRGDIYATAKKP